MQIVPRLLATLALSIAVASCGSSEPAPISDSGPTAEQSLNGYADVLVTKHPAELSGHDPAFLTMQSPLSYILVFKTNSPDMLTKDIADNDNVGYQNNLKVTERWQSMYCTEELKAIMRSHDIFSAGAHIVDASGKRHSLAVCTA